MAFRSNRIIGREQAPSETTSPRAQAMKRLRDAPWLIDVLSDNSDLLEVADFVMQPEAPGFSKEFWCSSCGAHVLIHHITVEGTVTCRCGPIAGKIL